MKRSIRSSRVTDFEVGQEDIWVAVDHVNNRKTFFNVKYVPCKSKLPFYKVHMDKIDDILSTI